MRPRAFVLVLLLALPSLLGATAPPRKVLFTGNSYTGQVAASIHGIFGASPHPLARLRFHAPGGKTLAFHRASTTTLDFIRSDDWDVIVLQEQSQTPALFPGRFLDASKELHAIITKAGAHTASYQTWGRLEGDPRSGGRFPDYESMQEALTQSYLKAAERDRAILVPVGEAWQRVRKERPVLGRELYKKDGSHPSAKGAFLAACCFYARLTGSDPARVRLMAAWRTMKKQTFSAKSRGKRSAPPPVLARAGGPPARKRPGNPAHSAAAPRPVPAGIQCFFSSLSLARSASITATAHNGATTAAVPTNTRATLRNSIGSSGSISFRGGTIDHQSMLNAN